jgi:PAS domain-containing protein
VSIPPSLPTRFLPAERATIQSVSQDFGAFAVTSMFQQILGMVPDAVLVLNSQRQIVYCNEDFLRLLSEPALRRVLGLRHGEALGCVHSDETAGGCGTTESCRECGFAKSIVMAQSFGRSAVECRIALKDGTNLDLRMWATQVSLGPRSFTAFVLRCEPRRKP